MTWGLGYGSMNSAGYGLICGRIYVDFEDGRRCHYITLTKFIFIKSLGS